MVLVFRSLLCSFISYALRGATMGNRDGTQTCLDAAPFALHSIDVMPLATTVSVARTKKRLAVFGYLVTDLSAIVMVLVPIAEDADRDHLLKAFPCHQWQRRALASFALFMAATANHSPLCHSVDALLRVASTYGTRFSR